MVKKITTSVSTKQQLLGRKAIVMAGSVIGGIIALVVAIKTDPESTEVIVIEETVETIVETPEDTDK